MTEVEAEPTVAAEIFGERIALARGFAASLAREGEQRGLIGPLEPARLWTRHILNSAIAASYFSGRVGDVGSGAGLPGIPLAIARPDVEWVLIEPMERRVAWLLEQKTALGLSNVEVVRARAEDFRPMRSFDVVTARAVSALRTLIPLTAPLVRPGGRLVLLKGASVAAEIDSAEKQLRRFGVTDAAVDVLGEGLLGEPTRVFHADVR